MSQPDVNAVRVTATRAENTETQSSLHTFPAGEYPLPSSVEPDHPQVTSLRVIDAAVDESTPPDDPSRKVNTCVFEVKGISAPIANMLRRLLLTETPTMAVDRVVINENDGVVLDEMLCHRIGMVPLCAPDRRNELHYWAGSDGPQQAEP